jgi:hypothetical protein
MNGVHRARRHIIRIVVGLACSATLASCASINGSPDPIISRAEQVGLLKPYRMDQAVIAFRSNDAAQRMGMSRFDYRNFVVGLYLNAVDAQYRAFRTALRRQRGIGNVGFDAVLLGLTGFGQFATEAAGHRLAAAATALTGLRGSIDKQIYFDQTLPALLASMDAERDRVKARILTNLKRDANQYPLDLAFTDIGAYETSATLDRAIDRITASANADRNEAAVEVAKAAIQSCDTDEDLFDPRSRIVTGLLEVAKGSDAVAQLTKIAARTNSKAVDANGQPLAVNDIVHNIRASILGSYCSVAALNGLIGEINTDLGAQII